MTKLQTGAFQDLAANPSHCYGCGPNHPTGLNIKSHWDETGQFAIAKHMPDEEFLGWPGLVYGGLLAMLIDCHSNWTVMAHQYRHEEREIGTLPSIECVTGNLNIKYLAPTPMGKELTLKAYIEGDVGRKTRVICEVWCNDVMTAKADSIFVRVDIEMLQQAANS